MLKMPPSNLSGPLRGPMFFRVLIIVKFSFGNSNLYRKLYRFYKRREMSRSCTVISSGKKRDFDIKSNTCSISIASQCLKTTCQVEIKKNKKKTNSLEDCSEHVPDKRRIHVQD